MDAGLYAELISAVQDFHVTALNCGETLFKNY